MNKNKYIDCLAEGEQIDDLFMVKAARIGETRVGKPYLALNLGDRSGEISGPVWENAESYKEICLPGKVIRVKGQVQLYRDKLQLKIDRIYPVDVDGIDQSSFVEASRRSLDGMSDELKKLIGGIKNVFLNKLLNTIFFTREAGEHFQSSPAAKGIHHAYLGGLFEHSLSMAHVALLLADHYEGIDRDLLIAGALLHDIGKTVELESERGVIDYTDSGRLKGHLVIGCELIGREASNINDFPEDLLIHLQHLILSHHGRQEFGSPVVPMTPEALLLSFIDDMDAKMNLVEQLRRKVKNKETQWSDYQRILERYLLLTPIEELKEDDSQEEMGQAAKQRSLF